MVAMMLPVAATPLSARACILSNVASEKACKPACCANKTCCATSNQHKSNTTQPLAKSDSSYQVNATSTALPTAVLPIQEFGVELFPHCSEAYDAHSPPTLALICIRLI